MRGYDEVSYLSLCLLIPTSHNLLISSYIHPASQRAIPLLIPPRLLHLLSRSFVHFSFPLSVSARRCGADLLHCHFFRPRPFEARPGSLEDYWWPSPRKRGKLHKELSNVWSEILFVSIDVWLHRQFPPPLLPPPHHPTTLPPRSLRLSY